METLTEMVKSYLDSQEWHYQINEAKEVGDDNVISLGFNLEHERISVYILLDETSMTYRIRSMPDLNKPIEEDFGILKAVNQYNSKRAFIKLTLDKDNDLCFGMDGIIYDLNKGMKYFVADLDIVLKEVDNETAQILRHAEHKSVGVFAKLFGR